MANGRAIVDSVTADDGFVTVKGEAHITVTFQAAGREFETMLAEVPFSEEISAKGCSSDAVIRAAAMVKNTKLHIEIREGEDNRTLTAECEVVVLLRGFRASKRGVVVGTFCFENDYNIVGEKFSASFPSNYFSQPHKTRLEEHCIWATLPSRIRFTAAPALR